MSKRRIVLAAVLVLIPLSAVVALNTLDSGFRLSVASPLTIPEYNTNLSHPGGSLADLFVPTRTSPEFESFRSASSRLSVLSCAADQHNESGSCIVNTRSCTISNGTGSQTWSNGSWSGCSLVGCNGGYHVEGAACIANTRSCTIANGGGTETWSGSWGACTVQNCNSGFHNESNVCVANVRSCTITNGSGNQTWSGSWGACQVTACNSGYHNESNTCVSNTRPCAVDHGSGTQTWSGSWGSCVLVSCISPYVKLNVTVQGVTADRCVRQSTLSFAKGYEVRIDYLGSANGDYRIVSRHLYPSENWGECEEDTGWRSGSYSCPTWTPACVSWNWTKTSCWAYDQQKGFSVSTNGPSITVTAIGKNANHSNPYWVTQNVTLSP